MDTYQEELGRTLDDETGAALKEMLECHEATAHSNFAVGIMGEEQLDFILMWCETFENCVKWETGFFRVWLFEHAMEECHNALAVYRCEHSDKVQEAQLIEEWIKITERRIWLSQPFKKVYHFLLPFLRLFHPNIDPRMPSLF